MVPRFFGGSGMDLGVDDCSGGGDLETGMEVKGAVAELKGS